MPKRTFQEMRKAILTALKDGKEHSYGDLERKADTNWKTVRLHCKDLLLFNAVAISEDRITITSEGRELLKKL
jgi:predicted transcriptional regulator